MNKKIWISILLVIVLFMSYKTTSYASFDQNGDGFVTQDEQYVWLVRVYGDLYNMLWLSDYFTGYNPAIPDYKKKTPDEILNDFKSFDDYEKRCIASMQAHPGVTRLDPPSPTTAAISEINKSKNAFLKDHPDRLDVYLYGGTTFYKSVNYSLEYNAYAYYINNPDLQIAIGADPEALIKHYVEYGKAEGRVSK